MFFILILDSERVRIVLVPQHSYFLEQRKEYELLYELKDDGPEQVCILRSERPSSE